MLPDWGGGLPFIRMQVGFWKKLQMEMDRVEESLRDHRDTGCRHDSSNAHPHLLQHPPPADKSRCQDQRNQFQQTIFLGKAGGCQGYQTWSQGQKHTMFLDESFGFHTGLFLCRQFLCRHLTSSLFLFYFIYQITGQPLQRIYFFFFFLATPKACGISRGPGSKG